MQSIVALFLIYCAGEALALRREYYIAMEEIVWSYNGPESSPFFKRPGPTRIGGDFKKAVFRQYTDSTFRTRSPRPKSLGLYGPFIRAEVKDTIVVHAFNRASRPYSIHPHGVFYKKSSEGALYSDNTTSSDKVDDTIPPGGKHKYIWEVRDEYAPGPDDPSCLTWAYHSHVHASRDQNTGLIGTLLTCKKGTLTSAGHRTDVDREFAAIVFIIDENESWYIDENIKNYTLQPDSVDKKDPDFIESNLFYSVNGHTFLTLSTEMCKGDLVHWHIIGMGSDLHTMQFTGNSVIINGHREDTATLFPATFTTAIMRPDNPGKWLFGCHVSHHASGGMVMGYEVHDKCGPSFGAEFGKGLGSVGDTIRTYYVAAEEVEWNYAPTGMNMFRQKPIAEDGQYSHEYFRKGPDRIGGIYIKAVYKEYTDDTFQVEMERDPVMGILGPVIYAEVGETIHVVFKNKANRVYEIEPHGVFFNSTVKVEPGKTHTYVRPVPDRVSPLEKDDNCVTHAYASMATIDVDQHTGLVGPIVICKRGMLADEMKKTVYYMLLATFDENESPYLQQNIDAFAGDPSSVDKDDEDFKESNRMRSINGLTFGNILGVQLCTEQYTDIRLLSIGSDLNNHAFILDGAAMKTRNEYTGMAGVFPHVITTVSVYPYEPGVTLYGCHVSNHGKGMLGFYESKYCSDPKPKFQPSAKRTIYLGIVEEIWDYLPRRFDHKGNSVDDPEHIAYLYAHQENGKYIGSKYKKSIFYEYTDATFTVRKPKPKHLGFEGPILKMEIGDEIKVVFKNMATITFNVQAIGIHVAGVMQGPVPPAKPGETVTYTWQVRPELAPNPDQPDCFASAYLSFVDFRRDAYSGARGPMVICRKGTLNQKEGGMADKEFSLLFYITDENLSHYVDENIREFAKADPGTFNKKDKSFVESNKMNHINGYMYHVPELNMKRGELVRWHLFAEGEEDIHSIHFHANAFVHHSNAENKGDVFNLYTGRYSTLLMRPDAVGEWLLHCHVNTHVDIGMVTTYTVHDQTAICKPKCSPYRCDSNSHIDCSLLGIGKTSHLLSDKLQVKVKFAEDVIFVPASSITQLDLSHNMALGDVKILKRTLSYFPRLHTLWLKNINLMNLPGDLFDENKFLRVVHLQNNRIQYFPGRYARPTGKIEVLDLRNNDVKSVSPNVLVGRGRRLKRLDLRGNNELTPECMNALHIDWRMMKFCAASDKFEGIPKSG
uniref:ferroxidase HEPHL1-like n=1 Tax=Styela clava TaxID=7725 RepID=UPI001939C8A1|nr:ferroxidase HEPHL1-like [Styela clava]XP_039249241.1 ferroxidase HEPHL1-like [Styela clava]